MHLFATGVALLLTAGLVLADLSCTTYYASASTSRVPTYKKSVTSTVTNSFVFYTQIKNGTTTSTVSFTYLTVKGSTTITVPTDSSFTPIIDAPTYERRVGAHRRAAAGPTTTYSTARRSPSPTNKVATKYPCSVECATATATTQTFTTTIITQYTTDTFLSTVRFHDTTHVATATAYAACGKNNVATKFNQKPINFVGALSYTNLCDPAGGTFAQKACANPRQCCAAIQVGGYEGFAWTAHANGTGFGSATGIACMAMTHWYFDTADSLKPGQSPFHIGNGPQGSGYYGRVL